MKQTFILIGCLFCFANLAEAELRLSGPYINDQAVTQVEAGASPKFYIEYTNKTGNDLAITGGQINLVYDPKIINEIVETSLSNNAKEPGQISLALEIEEPLKVKKNETITIATITVQLQEKSSLINKWLVFLDWSHPSLLAGSENITGQLIRPDRKFYEEAKPPEFSGLSSIASSANTLFLDWRTPAGAFDRTKYKTEQGEQLHFRIYRSLDGKEWEELGEGEPPYSGNLANIDYVYEDKELDDGTQYYYRVDAVDFLGNEKKGAILAGIPKDLIAPKDVTNLSGFVKDNQIILKWQNPADPDLGGIIIIRNESRPVSTKALETGREYYAGDLPFGRGQGEIIFASFQEDFDPLMVQNEFIDDYVEEGIEYYYTIYTYDRATIGPPTEMGRNYSKGSVIVMTTEGPVNNRTFAQQSLPAGSNLQNQASARLTDTPVVFPNPFRPSGSNTVTFQYSLSKNTTINLIITDLSLRVIKKISIFAGDLGGQKGLNKVVWDGRDEMGSLASNGPHLVNIFSREENRIIGKMRLTVYR